MIDKLENISYVETYTDEYGNYLSTSRKTRLPNNEEIIQKINEIIDYINAKEVEPTIKSQWLDKEKKQNISFIGTGKCKNAFNGTGKCKNIGDKER